MTTINATRKIIEDKINTILSPYVKSTEWGAIGIPTDYPVAWATLDSRERQDIELDNPEEESYWLLTYSISVADKIVEFKKGEREAADMVDNIASVLESSDEWDNIEPIYSVIVSLVEFGLVTLTEPLSEERAFLFGGRIRFEIEVKITWE